MITLDEAKDSKFVLPEDVILSPVSKLPKSIRSLFDYAESDYALTRRYARGNTKILSKDAALLLEQFKTPRTLVDGILAFSDAQSIEAMPVLEAANSMLFKLVSEDCLTVEGSPEAQATKPTFSPGDRFKEFEVVRCCQLLEDTEVYQVREGEEEFFALKIVRPNRGTPYMVELIERERRILEKLQGKSAPKLRDSGFHEDRPFLVMEWLNGFSLDQITGIYQKKAATVLDGAEVVQLQSQRILLAARLVEAYVHLHEAGCVHGDAHSRNVFVLEDNTVRIIDFGYGRILDDPNDIPPRAGVPAFYDPDMALGHLDAKLPPPANFLGEQYSVGVMVHELLGSDHVCKGRYLPLSINFDEQMRQIAYEPALSLITYFDRMDPVVDAAVMRALEKKPEDRHPSMKEFHEAMVRGMDTKEAPEETVSRRTILKLGSQSNRPGGQCIQQYVDWCHPDESWFDVVFKRHPACSIKFGGAGVAYTLYRLASRYESSDLLALADLWIAKTKAHLGAPNAFHGNEIDITASGVGYICPLHSPSGVHMVQAYICEAMGDLGGCQQSLDLFVRAATATTCTNIDLTIGKTGVLLACATALEHFGKVRHLDLTRIRALGDNVREDVWNELRDKAPIEDDRTFEVLGIAHGWAGLCYGALRWHSAAGTDPMPEVRERIDQLAALGKSNNKGIRWAYSTSMDQSAHGWCNGHSGFVHLWIEAARMYAEDGYLSLAEGAAASTWQDRRGVSSLCCGHAGKAYALIDLYNAVGDPRWLKRAEQMGRDAVGSFQTGYSLYKSMGGIAVMASDLTLPEYACFPMFGRES